MFALEGVCFPTLNLLGNEKLSRKEKGGVDKLNIVKGPGYEMKLDGRGEKEVPFCQKF